jgi:hypothetical protein
MHYFDKRMSWATFWAIFSQTHLVAWLATHFLRHGSCQWNVTKAHACLWGDANKKGG